MLIWAEMTEKTFLIQAAGTIRHRYLRPTSLKEHLRDVSGIRSSDW